MKQKEIEEYEHFLEETGLSRNTVLLYTARAKDFLCSCGGQMFGRKTVDHYVERMRAVYRPRTINIYIVSLNRYLRWAGCQEYMVRTERIQPRRSLNNILSMQEYHKMLDYAWKTGRKKYYMLMRVLAGTGIRVGELQYITVEAIKEGSTDVYNKGKVREIIISNELSDMLLEYCREENIDTGVLFEGNKGKAISRNAVWQMLTRLAGGVGVNKKKACPHSFRHLFAKTYMEKYGNLAELGDILGHSSLETTRIYTLFTVEEKRGRMDLLGL